MAVSAPSIDASNGKNRNARAILTPEAVLIPIELATISERAAAFLLDVMFILFAVFLIVFPFLILPMFGVSIVITVGLTTFVSFIIRNIYFLHFELAWRGATPGKRIVGLRVIDRNGGPLQPAAVVSRNLTREFEVFLPISILASFDQIPLTDPSWLLSIGWILVIGVIPFLNSDRMRGGDIIGGTIVMSLPRETLLADQARDELHYTFTDRQLLAYGNFELQVLEEIPKTASEKPQERFLIEAFSPDSDDVHLERR